MATPTVGSVGGYNTAGTLSSAVITGAVATNSVVTRFSYSSTFSESVLRIGDASAIGVIAHAGQEECTVELVYKSTNFPAIPPGEVITVASATDNAFDGTWYYAGGLNKATTPDGFESISFLMRRHFNGTLATQILPTP